MKAILTSLGAMIAIGLVASSMAVTAYAADQYDGKWVGTAPDKGDCGLLTVTMVIGGSTISGNVSGKHGSPRISSGKVEADGSARVKYGPTLGYEGTLRFSGDKFDGQFMTLCGLRDVTGGRQ